MDSVLLLIYCGSLLIRLGMLQYGSWQDHNMKLKFTDVDYYVFSDAANYVVNGQSPYIRETYRYTPLLAWMLTFNQYFDTFGKLLFILFDILTAIVIQKIVRKQTNCRQTLLVCVTMWLYNPIVLTVSSRGNAESIMAFLVNITIYTLQLKRYCLSGFFFALSVHFKIYPVIYALPIFLHLSNIKNAKNTKLAKLKALLSGVLNLNILKFFMAAAVTFIGLCYTMYHIYGFDFIEHTFLYHISRKDIKHNFSVYFYMFYLNDVWWFSIMTFLNQFFILVVLSFYFYHELQFCCFMLTFVFVMFNKICTSQYFLWYLSILPIVYPGLRHLQYGSLLHPLLLWGVSQGCWLGSAYFLEFKAVNSFVFVWLSSLLYFVCNAFILTWFMTVYKKLSISIIKKKRQ